MRTENKGLLVLFSVNQGRCIDDNFKSEIMGTGSPSAISSTVVVVVVVGCRGLTDFSATTS